MSGPRLTARDYKRARRTPLEIARRRGFGAGLALGLCVALLVYLIDHRVDARHTNGTHPAAVQARAAPPPKTGAPVDSPSPAAQGTADVASPRPARDPAPDPAAQIGRFDFYSMLPRFRVLVPGERGASALPAPVARPGGTGSSVYFVQAGSYRDPKIAERVRARLLRLGYDAALERVVIDSEVWLRVRVGPIRDSARLERLRAALRRLGIEGRVLHSGG